MDKNRIVRKVMANLEFEKESSKLTEVIQKIVHDGTTKFIHSFNQYVDKTVKNPMVQKTLKLLEEGVSPKDIADKLKRTKSTISSVFRQILKIIKDFSSDTNDSLVEKFINEHLETVAK